jgi:dTMP kinase
VLIAVEGIDGAGKATVTSLVRNRLVEGARSVEIVAFPRYGTPVGNQIGEALSRGVPSREAAFNLAALFAIDRFNWWQELGPRRSADRTFIADRWTPSNAAYLAAQTGCPDDAAWVFDLEYARFNLPRPDVTLWVRATTVETKRRMVARSEIAMRNIDSFEGDIDLQVRAQLAYEVLHAEDTSWVELDNAGSLNKLAIQVDDVVSRL